MRSFAKVIPEVDIPISFPPVRAPFPGIARARDKAQDNSLAKDSRKRDIDAALNI